MQKGTLPSRLTAALLFLLACAVVFLAFAAPLLDQARLYDESLATSRAQKSRFAAEAAALPQLRAQRKSLKQRPGPHNEYVRGDTASRAAASLLEAVKTTVQSGGATLVSAQVLSKTDQAAQPGAPAKIAVRAQMKASPEALQHVFHGLESGRPVLFLSDVTVTGRRLKRSIRNRDKKRETWEELLLDVRFVVTGFKRVPAKEAP
jgi:general secretion pathway protein M